MDSTNTSQWTLDTLCTHLTAVIAANDIRYSERFESSQVALLAAITAQKSNVDAAIAAAEGAVNKAEKASEKRFDSVNEFRGTLADQQRTLMPRAEAEILFRQLSEKIDANTKALVSAAGHKSGARDLWGYIVAAAGLVMVLIFHFVK